MTNLPPVHNKFYYIRCQQGDLNLVISCLGDVPEARREEVANKYERIYLEAPKAARLKANKFIKNIAKEYRNTNHG